jgi:hypothetical protein
MSGHSAVLLPPPLGSWCSWSWVYRFLPAIPRRRCVVADYTDRNILLSPMRHRVLPPCTLQISNLVQKVSDAKVDALDAHKFIQSVAEQPGAFLDYRVDAQGCLEAVVWALPEQVEAMQLYGDVWIQDNTCKTLAANRPFFAIVGVDGNSRYVI